MRRPLLLVCDAPNVHNFTVAVCAAAAKYNIDICKLPHNSTTTTQPLDCVAFKEVKKRYFKILENLKIAGEYASAFLDSELMVMFKNIMPAWMKPASKK